MSKTLSSNQGIGLVSLMVAVALLAVAATMAVSVFFSASRITQHAAHFSTASNYAEGVLERVRTEPFDRITTREITDGLPRLPQAKCLVAITPEGEGTKIVAVTCYWQEGEVERKATFSTIVAKGGAR